MERVICDICGTIYSEAEEKCPTCGCSRDFGLENMEEEFLTEGVVTTGAEAASPQKKNKEIFDFDEVNQIPSDRDIREEDDFDDEEDDEEEPRTNVGLVVVLLVLIVLLLVTAGIFFVRYFLPNMNQAGETQPATTVALETEPVVSTELNIPCVNISVPGGMIELGEGGKWLMNVQVFPKNTTDVLSYASSDEAVVMVSEDGTVTAVGEGSAEIIVTCGSKQISTNVVVDYSAEEETVSVDEIPAMEVEGDDATASTEETTAEADASESTEATTAADGESTDATASTGIELKLKKTDISIFARYTSITLELDCDLELTDLTWFTMDSTVAIVNDGVVTATGSGITRIYGDYGDQRVECIIRCSF